MTYIYYQQGKNQTEKYKKMKRKMNLALKDCLCLAFKFKCPISKRMPIE